MLEHTSLTGSQLQVFSCLDVLLSLDFFFEDLLSLSDFFFEVLLSLSGFFFESWLSLLFDLELPEVNKNPTSAFG
jgi:hypothetical protein